MPVHRETNVSNKPVRTYSSATEAALRLLAKQIRLARKQRGLSERALAERVGIARSTLQLVERGDPRVEIGLVFEAAIIAGVELFGEEGASTSRLARLDDKLALLPKSVRPARHADDVDDF
jgi:transcriptional regulator with XRE-family HTH domain